MWTRLPSSSLRVTGPDRLDFVQGQMTGDLRGAPMPGMVPCAFLNVRGQIEVFARAYKRPLDIYLHLDPEQAPLLAARFKRYIIFDQVEVEDLSAELSSVHVWEPQQLPGWQASGEDAQQFELAGQTVLAARVNRRGQVGLDLHFLTRRMGEVLSLLGEERPYAELEGQRLAAGIPDVWRDGWQGYLLQEVGLDVGGPLPAISYRKGCYVGQEIMARVEARGNARYHLVRLVSLDGSELAARSDVLQAGKVVGQTGGAMGAEALARLRKEIADGEMVDVSTVGARVQWLEPWRDAGA